VDPALLTAGVCGVDAKSHLSAQPPSHDASVKAICVFRDKPMDRSHFEAWLHQLIAASEGRVFRCKGRLHFTHTDPAMQHASADIDASADMAGGAKHASAGADVTGPWTLQGVHGDVVLSPPTSPWPRDEQRGSTVVLLGRQLDTNHVQASLNALP